MVWQPHTEKAQDLARRWMPLMRRSCSYKIDLQAEAIQVIIFSRALESAGAIVTPRSEQGPSQGDWVQVKTERQWSRGKASSYYRYWYFCLFVHSFTFPSTEVFSCIIQLNLKDIVWMYYHIKQPRMVNLKKINLTLTITIRPSE